MRSAVTALFVPGDRPERFERAAAAGADVVIIDLEDAVAPERKHLARAAAARALASGTSALLRVNPPSDPEHAEDMALVRNMHESSLLGLMVPKADTATPWAGIRRDLGDDRALMALVETAKGYVGLRELAHIDAVDRLAFGAFDFAADVDATESAVIDAARAEIVITSRAARKAAPLDSPSPHLDDEDAVSGDARKARHFGFGGMMCIHPRQIAAVESAFLPTGTELEWARRIVTARPGATRVDGEMVDAPVIARATRILHRRGPSA